MKAIDRLFEYFEYKKIRHTKVERELGLANGYFRRMQKDNGNMGESYLVAILNHYNDLNIEWLILGKGNMLKTEKGTGSDIKDKEEIITLLKEKNGFLEEKISFLEEKIQQYENKEKDKQEERDKHREQQRNAG